jgi:GMP synthase PP-ATPase subunit
MKQEEMAPVEKAEIRFYLIFDELAKAGAEDLSNASLEEIDEIEKIGRMVADVSNTPPRFLTST